MTKSPSFPRIYENIYLVDVYAPPGYRYPLRYSPFFREQLKATVSIERMAYRLFRNLTES